MASIRTPFFPCWHFLDHGGGQLEKGEGRGGGRGEGVNEGMHIRRSANIFVQIRNHNRIRRQKSKSSKLNR